MNDREALALVSKEAPLLSLAESQFVRTIGKLETSYGRGWKDNSDIPGAVGDPRKSFNWGAITTTKSPFFTYMDGFPVKEPRKFRMYPNDGFGIRDLSRELFVRRRSVQSAVHAGDGKHAVAQMKATKYFEAPLEAYQKKAKEVYESIIQNTNEPRALSFDGVVNPFIGFALSAGFVYAVEKFL